MITSTSGIKNDNSDEDRFIDQPFKRDSSLNGLKRLVDDGGEIHEVKRERQLKIIHRLPFDEDGISKLLRALILKGMEQRKNEQLKKPRRCVDRDARRRYYCLQEKQLIVNIYRKFKVKQAALDMINSIEGYHLVNRKMILEWARNTRVIHGIKQSNVPLEFEESILHEYEKYYGEHGKHSINAMKQSGVYVLNSITWDDESEQFIAKWLQNPLTKNFVFDNQWAYEMFAEIGATDVKFPMEPLLGSGEDDMRGNADHQNSNSSSIVFSYPELSEIRAVDEASRTITSLKHADPDLLGST